MLPSAFWLLALILFSVVEGVTVGLTSIWFAIGALGALVAAILGAHIFLQVLIFLVLSALALALVRPIAVRLLKPRHDPTNADRVIGQTALVTEDIDNVEGKGLVVIAGQVWSARSEHNVSIPAGTQVRVLRIEGAYVCVERISDAKPAEPAVQGKQ